MHFLWIAFEPRPPHPSTGARAVVAARFAIGLEAVRRRLMGERERLARRVQREAHRAPPSDDPHHNLETVTNSLSRLSALIGDVDLAIERGHDLQCRERDPLERWCGGMLLWSFDSAECSACGTEYRFEQCVQTDWDSVGGPRVGVGGKLIECPGGHAIYVRRTWIS